MAACVLLMSSRISPSSLPAAMSSVGGNFQVAPVCRLRGFRSVSIIFSGLRPITMLPTACMQKQM